MGDMFQYRDKTVIKQLKVKALLEKDVLTISADKTLGDIVQLVKKSRRNIFVVIGEKKTFIGMVKLDDVRNDMFDLSKYEEPITDYMVSPLDDEKVQLAHDVQEIINKFNKTGNYNMIVLDGERYIGIISRANLLKAYRENMIADINDY